MGKYRNQEGAEYRRERRQRAQCVSRGVRKPVCSRNHALRYVQVHVCATQTAEHGFEERGDGLPRDEPCREDWPEVRKLGTWREHLGIHVAPKGKCQYRTEKWGTGYAEHLENSTRDGDSEVSVASGNGIKGATSAVADALALRRRSPNELVAE